MLKWMNTSATKSTTMQGLIAATAEFQKAGFDENGSNNLVQLAKLFPLCVVESSFTKEDGTPASGKEIADLLEPSASTMTNVLMSWFGKIPFRTV